MMFRALHPSDSKVRRSGLSLHQLTSTGHEDVSADGMNDTTGLSGAIPSPHIPEGSGRDLGQSVTTVMQPSCESYGGSQGIEVQDQGTGKTTCA